MKKEREYSNQLLAFTFFYSVVIYLLFLGYHYWDKHIDYKNDNSR